MALSRPVVPTPPREFPEALVPARLPFQDVTNIFHNLTVSKTPQPASPLVSTPGRSVTSSIGMHLPHQQFALCPVVYHSNLPGAPGYLLEQTPTRSQSVVSMATHLPTLSPMFTPPATPLTNNSDYGSPRAVQTYSLRQDGRRQNAMRVNRSPYYNAATHHNHVDVNRIREGIDVRTTVSFCVTRS
jgi:hypothetical protein